MLALLTPTIADCEFSNILWTDLITNYEIYFSAPLEVVEKPQVPPPRPTSSYSPGREESLHRAPTTAPSPRLHGSGGQMRNAGNHRLSLDSDSDKRDSLHSEDSYGSVDYSAENMNEKYDGEYQEATYDYTENYAGLENYDYNEYQGEDYLSEYKPESENDTYQYGEQESSQGNTEIGTEPEIGNFKQPDENVYQIDYLAEYQPNYQGIDYIADYDNNQQVTMEESIDTTQQAITEAEGATEASAAFDSYDVDYLAGESVNYDAGEAEAIPTNEIQENTPSTVLSEVSPLGNAMRGARGCRGRVRGVRGAIGRGGMAIPVGPGRGMGVIPAVGQAKPPLGRAQRARGQRARGTTVPGRGAIVQLDTVEHPEVTSNTEEGSTAPVVAHVVAPLVGRGIPLRGGIRGRGGLAPSRGVPRGGPLRGRGGPPGRGRGRADPQRSTSFGGDKINPIPFGQSRVARSASGNLASARAQPDQSEVEKVHKVLEENYTRHRLVHRL